MGLVRGAGGRAGSSGRAMVLGVGDVLGLLGSAPKRRVAPSGRAAAAVGARLEPRARCWA